MNKAQRRKDDLEKYKRKWGMSDYRIFVQPRYNGYNEILLARKGSKPKSYSRLPFSGEYIEYTTDYTEIVSIGSFLKRIQSNNIKITIYEINNTFQVFQSFDEVKSYMLIQKIAGV